MKLNNPWLASLLICGSLAGSARSQVDREDPEFVEQSPKIGDQFPVLTIFNSTGSEFKTSQFRGNYTVVTFGCLTCPPFIRKVVGLEAVYRDYGPKNVRFYFIYKSLAHPERNGITQPITQDERIHQASEATKRLGNTIPFLVDALDNRLKHALIDRHNVPVSEPAAYDNAEFIIDPEGAIVRKRSWSNPEQLRKDLEALVGKVDIITKPEDVILNAEKPTDNTFSKAAKGRISRTGLYALVSRPRIDPGGLPFYAKLRAEGDENLIAKGEGKLYLGFHLNPFLGAHWNNVNNPLRFELELPEGVKFSSEGGVSKRTDTAANVDPQEFLLDVAAWPKDKIVRLTVIYSACTESVCHEVYQVYELRCEHDWDGGRSVHSLSKQTPEEPTIQEERPSPTKIALVLLAIVFWPCWIPFATAAIETNPRRRWLLALGIAGLALGCACYIPTTLNTDDVFVLGVDGEYTLSPESTIKLYACMLWQGLYLALTSVLLLTSRLRGLRVSGILVAVVAVMAHMAFRIWI